MSIVAFCGFFAKAICVELTMQNFKYFLSGSMVQVLESNFKHLTQSVPALDCDFLF